MVKEESESTRTLYYIFFGDRHLHPGVHIDNFSLILL